MAMILTVEDSYALAVLVQPGDGYGPLHHPPGQVEPLLMLAVVRPPIVFLELDVLLLVSHRGQKGSLLMFVGQLMPGLPVAVPTIIK